MGFPQVSVSHEVSPLVKLVGRGDTTVVDAYLTPILKRYVDQVAEDLGVAPDAPVSPGMPSVLGSLGMSGHREATRCPSGGRWRGARRRSGIRPPPRKAEGNQARA